MAKLFEVRHHRDVIDYVDAPSLALAIQRYRDAYPDMIDEVAFVEVEAVRIAAAKVHRMFTGGRRETP